MIVFLSVGILILLFLNLLPKYAYKEATPLKLNGNLSPKFGNYDFIVKYQPTGNDDSHKYCETIHIGIVCAGNNANLYFHNLLKSLLFYRVNPLHFHLVVNDISKIVLQKLLSTWELPKVTVTFYNLNNYTKDIRWIPNSHYSGLPGLTKLLIPKIIPKNVTDKIIVLDTDLTVLGDILELWNMFSNFTKNQCVGLVENQSDYYLGKYTTYSPWPAIEKGFNSGVVLYDFRKLSSFNWDNLWPNITKKYAIVYGATKLGDQDIINAVIKENPQILYKLPCYWNTQMSDRTQSSECYKKHKVKILHWNSPRKFYVRNKGAEYFRKVAETFMEYNGNLLKRNLQFCNDEEEEIKDESEDPCQEFKKVKTFRTLLYFREFKYTPVEDDITYVAHLSYDRLQSLETLAKFWEGPISVSIYLSDLELRKAVRFILESSNLQERSNIAYHAVFQEDEHYPINILRNVALENVKTPYVFLSDIDFVPMKNLYEILKSYLATFEDLTKKALIVPAFQLQKYRSKVPRNKIDVINGLQKKTIVPFLSNIWEPGHKPTNFEKWTNEMKPYKVQWQPDFEPYIVVKSDVVKYDERFVGFGWNKVSHIMELEAQNYEFIVLSDVFIIHKPHSPSNDILQFRTSPTYRMCLQMVKLDFMQRLSKQYNRTFENIVHASERSKRDVDFITANSAVTSNNGDARVINFKGELMEKQSTTKKNSVVTKKPEPETTTYYFESNTADYYWFWGGPLRLEGVKVYYAPWGQYDMAEFFRLSPAELELNNVKILTNGTVIKDGVPIPRKTIFEKDPVNKRIKKFNPFSKEIREYEEKMKKEAKEKLLNILHRPRSTSHVTQKEPPATDSFYYDSSDYEDYSNNNNDDESERFWKPCPNSTDVSRPVNTVPIDLSANTENQDTTDISTITTTQKPD